MADNTRCEDNKLNAAVPGEKGHVPATGRRLSTYISAGTLLLIIFFYVIFLFGIYDPLFLTAIISLVVIPFLLIGGIIFCSIKGKWVPLIVGVVTLPPAWVLSLLAAMSDYPQQTSHRYGYIILAAGPLAAWLFATLAFRQGRSKPTGG